MRIIAGTWRSRRIPVLPHASLRPSSDRARETLFNWLNPYVEGARCLDLFAGSGVLGFEALSRGAAEAIFVENDSRVVSQLQSTAALFNHPGVTIFQRDASDWLGTTPPIPQDLIFLDPPFGEDSLIATITQLQTGWLASSGIIYVESGRNLDEISLPTTLEWTKRAQIGNVSLGLASRLA